jgi:hypothetical protein
MVLLLLLGRRMEGSLPRVHGLLGGSAFILPCVSYAVPWKRLVADHLKFSGACR